MAHRCSDNRGPTVHIIVMTNDLFAQGYFDALRMEIKSDNIDVQMVCPGPIISSISKNAFSSQLDKVPMFCLLSKLILFYIAL